MASIDVSYPYRLPKDEARKKIEELARRYEAKVGIVWTWVGDTMKFDAPSGVAKGVRGHVSMDDSHVRVVMELPFLLRMMKATIEQKIQKRLGGLG